MSPFVRTRNIEKAMLQKTTGLSCGCHSRKIGVDKAGVLEILDGAGLGLPAYYAWRTRSGCTFCFFQQKIEWVRLKEHHPEAFEEAKAYEKNSVDHGSPFTWSQGEALEELEKPETDQTNQAGA